MRPWLVLSIHAAACGRVQFEVAGDAGARDVEMASDAAQIAGLIGWWKLDEGSGTTANDSRGSTNGVFFGSG